MSTRSDGTHQRPHAQDPDKNMYDLATEQGRIAWARDVVLRMTHEELTEALARLPEPRRFARPPYNVSRYETGARPVPLAYYRALSELSGISLDWLIEGRTPRGTAIDAIRRMRHALDQIEEHYRADPLDVPLDAYERLAADDDDGDQSGGST